MPENELKAKKKYNISKKLKAIPLFLGLNAFAVTLVLALLAGIIGAVVFYNYFLLVDWQVPETSSSSIKFKKDVYQRVLEQLPKQEIQEPLENPQ